MEVDVLIIGGGPAGLSAALILGRCRRKVLLADEGQQRNRASGAVHGLLGREGLPPALFLQQANEGLARYPSVTRRATRVTELKHEGGRFGFTCADGTGGVADKVLLATGLTDELPKLGGVESLYGKSVHHCIYCDGYEYAGLPVAAFGKGDRGADLSVMLKHWTPDVVACSDGCLPSAEALRKPQAFDIPLRPERVGALEGRDGRLERIRFASGSTLARAALFFATGCHQGSDFADRLGCRRDEKGGVITDPLTEETSVAGVYVGGDASRDMLMVAVALGEGAKSAVAINEALLRRDGYCR